MANQEEDPIERLARRTAEENDRLARKRQQENLDAWQAPRTYPSGFLLFGLGLFAVSMSLLFDSCGH